MYPAPLSMGVIWWWVGGGAVGGGAAGEKAMPVACPEGAPEAFTDVQRGAPEALTETRRVSTGVHQRH